MARTNSHRLLPAFGIVLMGIILGCTGSNSSAVPRINKNSNANAKPCPKSQRLVNDELSLVAPDDLVNGVQEPLTAFEFHRAGGFVDIGFQGVPTRLSQFSDSGNEQGYVDVLNIPYCTNATSVGGDPDVWIRRCLNRRVQEKLASSIDLRAQFLKSWQTPSPAIKRCTAQFSMDPSDTDLSVANPRVRVWTAEHCFQPAYASDVTLQIYLPRSEVSKTAKVSRGVYVPVRMAQPDALVWRDKVLATRGGGGAVSDPLLNEKILALRSTDGRSSQFYRDSVEKYCLDYTGSDLPKLNGKPPEFVDCYSMTDVSTFKGTIGSNQPSLAPNSRLVRDFGPAAEQLRRQVVDVLLAGAIKSKAADKDSGLSGQFPAAVRKYISPARFALSIFDGFQHGRRIQAFEHELNAANMTTQSAIATSLSPFGDLFSMLAVDFTGNDLDDILNGLCSLIGQVCSRRVYQPLDTKALEEIALGSSRPDMFEFLAQRINVLIMKIANNQIINVEHPLRINSGDTQFTANFKFLSFQMKLWLDIMLMHKNPAAGIPTVSGFASTFQRILEVSCSARSWGGILFPTYGNVMPKNGSSLSFERILPVRPGKMIQILPVGVSNPEDYAVSRCQSVSLLNGLGPEAVVQGRAMPSETVFAVRINDAAVSPGPNADLKEYLSSRVMFVFEGAESGGFSVAGPGDSGALFTFMGIPAYVLSTHNREPVNGVVLAEPPELNEPAASGADGSGASAGVCK